ncbi:Dnaj-like protein [Thalictrum thalictroides]|uniref:Dnaj-like protein n=1 Tax=Thalictrum thalictroides TaxID=46969 RepID=A0A7J6X195_THATH|nr:Dnaj-like protein [Thalictrum thalictroides]
MDPPEGVKERGQDQIYSLKVSLEQLSSGTSKKFPISRYVVCPKCNGNGSKSGASMKCSGCQGTHKKISIRPCPFDPDVDEHILEIGDQITFPGQADEAPDYITGDNSVCSSTQTLISSPYLQCSFNTVFRINIIHVSSVWLLNS